MNNFLNIGREQKVYMEEDLENSLLSTQNTFIVIGTYTHTPELRRSIDHYPYKWPELRPPFYILVRSDT